MKIKVGDKVRVITGSNKGKEGKVSKVLRSESRVIVEGVNIVKNTLNLIELTKQVEFLKLKLLFIFQMYLFFLKKRKKTKI